MSNKIIVSLEKGQTFTDWLRTELKSLLNKRYRAVHMAEDIGVINATLHRFLHDGEARGTFYDKVFKYLTERKND